MKKPIFLLGCLWARQESPKSNPFSCWVYISVVHVRAKAQTYNQITMPHERNKFFTLFAKIAYVHSKRATTYILTLFKV